MRILCSIIVVLVLAAPARAADVARVGLGSQIDELVAGSDGGAWVRITRGPRSVVGRAGPDGRFVTNAAPEPLRALAIGPDGLAWLIGERRAILRSDTGGNLERVGAFPVDEPPPGDLAAGPDGTLWTPAHDGKAFGRVTREGVVSFTPFGAPCAGSGADAVAPAPDGSVWFADFVCHRLVRAAPDGTWSAIPVGDATAELLAPDATGGAWYASGRSIAHTGGARFVLPEEVEAEVSGLAVGPDGAAWAATGLCRLVRVTAAGELTLVPAPIGARHIAFGPNGRWLASGARLVDGDTATGACDDRGPDARVTPSRRISLAALRRRGVRFTVREPAHLNLDTRLGDERTRVLQRGGTLRYIPSRARLRRVARRVADRGRTTVWYTLAATDRDGNTWHTDGEIEVTR